MGDRRLKLAHGLGGFVPEVINFSRLEELYPHSVEHNDGEHQEYTPSDNSLEQERMENNIMYEELIVNILCNLEPREQIVFVFQLLRDAGYQIDHASFAKTQHLSRRQFMRALEAVRQKTRLYIMGYRHDA